MKTLPGSAECLASARMSAGLALPLWNWHIPPAADREDIFEIYLNPWDYAAGMLLIQEAGGKVTDFTGKALNPRKGSSVAATNGYIHTELLKLI